MIIARHISGSMGTLRSWTRYLLLLIFFVTPWLNAGGRQALLMDIANRKFYFPGFVIWPQEFYFLLIALITLGLILFLFTALFGRLWCGWACPQTVYVELFDSIGRLLFPSRFGKRSATPFHHGIIHFIWLVIAMVSAYHFIGYFTSIRGMTELLFSNGLSIFASHTWPWFWVVSGILFYSDVGLFREQLCVFLCPYARFQSALLDEDSIIIAYDEERGEPRRQNGSIREWITDKPKGEKRGDCTGCNLCVVTCPTGIDIREGLQVACVGCAHCIDACTTEMGRYNKKSLVAYGSSNWIHEKIPTSFLRSRTIVYILLVIFVASIGTYFALDRTPIHLSIIPDRTALPYRGTDQIRNVYNLSLANLQEVPAEYSITARVRGGDDSVIKKLEIITGEDVVYVGASSIRPTRVIINATLQENPPPTRNVAIEFVIENRLDPSIELVKRSIFTIPPENPQ